MRDGELSGGSPRRRRNHENYYFAEVPNALKSNTVPMNSYLGYSVSSGRFFSSRPTHLYVSGAPRANHYKGKVYLFDFPENHEDEDLQYIRDLDGTQMGEYFGGALCVVDLNGDRLDDLVVAAPQFSLQATNSAKLVGDEGRIYVFINGDNGRFKEITGDRMIMGNRRYGARFGTAVANVGDLNMDGYEDIAVGAPYEGNGVVFIYHGDKSGIIFEPVQKIFAEKIDPGLNGFGISLSGGVDVDGNHYNDVAVGAFESGHAVVLRGHPIITFHPELTTSTSRISLKTSNFSSRACLSYKGSYVPETADAKVTMTVDLSYGRAHFISEELKISNNYTYEVKLRSESPQCKDFYIAIRPSSKDPTRPIDVVMKYELVNNPNEDTHNSGSDGFCMNCPVVDVRQPTYIIKRVAFETGCKRDICEPDLVADARFIGIKEKFVLGEQTTLQMEVEVQNIGEPAFLARLVLVIPRVTPLVRIPPNCQDSTEKHATEVQTLVCDIGNPLEKNNTIIVVMNTQDIPVDTTSLVFSINATSVGNESTAVDNYKKLVLPIVIQADMTITGLSSQDQIVYVAQNKSFRDDLILSHSFEVWNLGPSNVETVTIEFEIPHQLDGPNGETIFMQVFEPQLSMTASSGTITCGPEDPFFYYKSDETSKGEVSIEIDPTTFKEDDGPDSNVVKSSVVSKRSVSDDEFPPSSPNFVPPPSNRTLFLNCSSQKVDCFKVKCLAGPFTPIKSRATINFKLKPILQTLETSLDNKDIILFSSRGKVSILSPPGSMQQIDHKPDGVTVHTVFHGKIPEGSIATWIIVLAIICGILILFFIAMALHKVRRNTY
ncbi:Integrin alpha-PS3 [Zootermopsis nevadensis]|uniref:Integrin alpha-PS3 n=1 Tax=Zootermopsis nevadensis TaxID=136037 RepID=A0A067QVE4_ZOONE|nr:Integrin alpha-PS3 [Zootermopsis nevadensis]